jgi:hypothetical protein
MSKTTILVAMFFPSTLFAAMPVLTPSTQAQHSEQSQSTSLIGTHRAGVFDQLSMGPDPGGKSGDTVTQTTSKTGQPSADGAGASNQSGTSSTAPRPAVPRSSISSVTVVASSQSARQTRRRHPLPLRANAATIADRAVFRLRLGRRSSMISMRMAPSSNEADEWINCFLTDSRSNQD